jgi:hypothetical protein
MSPTQSSMYHPIPDAQPTTLEGRCHRDHWLFGAPVLVIVIALCHLAACWNSQQPSPLGSWPHRTIHLVRAAHQVPASTSGLRTEPSLVADDEPAFDQATLPAPGPSWPYRAGWR